MSTPVSTTATVTPVPSIPRSFTVCTNRESVSGMLTSESNNTLRSLTGLVDRDSSADGAPLGSVGAACVSGGSTLNVTFLSTRTPPRPARTSTCSRLRVPAKLSPPVERRLERRAVNSGEDWTDSSTVNTTSALSFFVSSSITEVATGWYTGGVAPGEERVPTRADASPVDAVTAECTPEPDWAGVPAVSVAITTPRTTTTDHPAEFRIGERAVMSPPDHTIRPCCALRGHSADDRQ